MVKRLQILFILCTVVSTLSAQSILISDNSSATTPDGSAMLELRSDSLAFLMPRLTLAQIQSISSPATGLIVYESENSKPVFYDGTDWLYMDNTVVAFSKKKSANAIEAEDLSKLPLKELEMNGIPIQSEQ